MSAFESAEHINSAENFEVGTAEFITEAMNIEEVSNADGEGLKEEFAQVCGTCTVVTSKKEEKDEHYVPPSERLVIPADICDFKPGDTTIFVVGTRGAKVTKIGGLDHMAPSLKELVLRSCLIADMDGSQNLTNLTKLELYDNQIEAIIPLPSLTSLKILDISFNAIREMAPVASCPLLEELYIAQNKLRKIEGLENLTNLRTLDLGANRIREMQGLSACTNLESLWLGKNKIEEIAGIEGLTKLRQLDVQNNRLRSLGTGLLGLTNLEELYLACNAIENVNGLPVNSPLNTLDLSTNRISCIAGIEQHQHLTELWMTASLLASFEALEPLVALPHLECLYLEHSPIASDFEYRMRITKMISSLVQLDANAVNRRT